jgi:hypothetical protein
MGAFVTISERVHRCTVHGLTDIGTGHRDHAVSKIACNRQQV